MIIVNTRAYKEDAYRSIEFKVTCTADGGMKGEEIFTIDTLLKVNDGVKFNVPSITAYAGSKYIYVPSNYVDIQGNSPELSKINTTAEELDLEYFWAEPKDVTYTGPELTSVKSLRHIGENVFSAWNDDMAVFFHCDRSSKTEAYKCKGLPKALDLNFTQLGTKYVKAQVFNGILVTLTTTLASKVNDTKPAHTYITANSIVDNQQVFTPIRIEFSTKIAEFRMWENNVTIITLGSRY